MEPIGFKLFFWTILTIIMALTIADRFTLNVWPRDDFKQPLVGDSDSIRQGPWSVWFDDFFSKLSGR